MKGDDMKSMRLFGSVGGGWSSREVDKLVKAANEAPLWCTRRPWVVEPHRRSAELFQVPLGDGEADDDRARLLSCGAALTNLRLAVLVTGWHALVDFADTPHRGGLIATVRAGHRRSPTAAELARFEAIGQVGVSHVVPRPGSLDPVLSARLAASHWWRGTRLEPLTDPRDAAILGELVLSAIRRMEGELTAADELAAWSAPRPRRDRWSGASADTAAGAGTSRRSWLSSRSAVAARIASEQVMAVVTGGDMPSDHLGAGAAIQSACLAAQAMGLISQPVVELVSSPEARADLGVRLGLRGYPQALLRVGPSMAGVVGLTPSPRTATSWS